MDISIFGYKFNLEVLILIGIIYLILVAHTLCGCCNRSIMEAFTDQSGNVSISNAVKKVAKAVSQDVSGNVQDLSGNLATKINNAVGTEGFVGANINYGQSSLFDLTDNSTVNTSSWSQPDMTVVPGQPLSANVKNFLAREPQPVPLPEGEMLMFANTPFKPECCPNSYSNSTGCACMTGQQYNYLIGRGGNNVPYSEY